MPLLLGDTFDGVVSTAAGDSGLDTGLPQRQRGALVPATYTLLPGVWYASPPAATTTAVVDSHATDGTADRLSLRGFTAVQLNAPVAFGPHGAVEIHANIDPVVRDTASTGWVSIMVVRHRNALGWVNDPENVAAILVRSNGEIAVAAHGTDRPVHWTGSPLAAAPSYAVALSLHTLSSQAGRELRLDGTINGASFTSTLASGGDIDTPASVIVDLGAHFLATDVQVSTIDDLEVFGVHGAMPAVPPPPETVIPNDPGMRHGTSPIGTPGTSVPRSGADHRQATH